MSQIEKIETAQTGPAGDEVEAALGHMPRLAPLPHDLLTLEELSAYLQVPVGTIKRWRTEGYGPRAAHVQKELRYYRGDVITWLQYLAQDDERCTRDAYPAQLKAVG